MHQTQKAEGLVVRKVTSACDGRDPKMMRINDLMKRVSTIILMILMLLANASGITNIALTQQDVELFGKYWFS